ncbi:MAG: helix-turn-helix domain-containing protein [Drouetiella hepatica Uher 2000/2452]|jgi:transcriptional regulator with XRE-family HTH domain|uniref:Helix-turn-helix domain-containing protein n=1 Tax=Drouetiella hepatica Uher 2000/2452 TaxID=904376 RepID=A0A951UR70_9CYAN|nr:helix-turn-helix domain-containing protein [Drouetiella hepatica Uher 2000/2452]
MTILVASGNDELAKEKLAQLIKELRGHTTQREFAKLLGTSYTSVQDWEKQIRLPKEDNLKRIAQLKGWTQEELLRHLFFLDDQAEVISTNPMEVLIPQIQTLSLPQMQQLSDYLTAQLTQAKVTQAQLPQDQSTQKSDKSRLLSEMQKHNLHLLLRASLKNQSPTEAMAKVRVKPDVFTNIFLRNYTKQVVSYNDLQKLSSLCCRVIQWRAVQPPEIDCRETYLGETELLFQVLAESLDG